MPITRSEKSKVVESVKKDLKAYPIVAVATLQNLPSRQYNAIKKKLRGKAVIDVARSSLLRRAIDEGRPELKELEKHFVGSTALVFTNQNPFQLFQTLKGAQSKTKAKPGQIAPIDLVVPKGETNLAPGPVLTELKNAGVSAKIQGPKVVIDRDSTIAKKGDVITHDVASVLSKLGVEPMTVGLDVLAVFEAGTIYLKDTLNIDNEAFMQELVGAHQRAVNLAVYAEIFNSVSTPIIVTKAERAANALRSIVDKPAEAKVEEKPAETPAEPAVAPAETPAPASEAPAEKKE
ncbi:50S ribosomal protein L10 [Candidatus Micrarchaeota archaeon CG1_02_55_22]|nr:MAG: 50S ribosomal protein L10 [Candidatus Micrarchaeota archaeon CG1_02_55_22]